MEIVWLIENVLAQSEYPHTRDLDALYNKGIRAIISLEKRNDTDFIRKKGFEYLEVYVKDYTAPTIEQLSKVNKFIDTMINGNNPVLVHCFVGSRSGAILVSYLIHRGKSLNHALSEVKKIIPITCDYDSLKKILKKYEQSLKK